MEAAEPSGDSQEDLERMQEIDPETLRGLQEEAAIYRQRLEELYSDVRDKPLVVDKVLISGLERTRGYVVARELEGLRGANTLGEIKEELLSAQETLDGLNIFHAVEMVIDKGEKEGHANVRVLCHEKGRINLHGGTYVQGSEGSVEIVLGLVNVVGIAEAINVMAEWGSKGTNEYSVQLVKPRPQGRPVVLDLRLAQLTRDFQRHSSFTEQLRHAAITLATEDGKHGLSYELGWSKLADPSKHASRAVRQQLGDNLKSSIKYMYRYDTFPDSARPISGWGYRSTSEVAGLGLDAKLLRFARQTLQGYWATPLPYSNAAYASLSVDAGFMAPFGAGGRTSIADRFFLGGPGSLRGFQTRSVGPTDVRREPERPPTEAGGQSAAERRPRAAVDYLGGDLYATVMAAINFPLPHPALEAAGLMGHIFLNGGNTALLSGSGRPFQDAVRNFADSIRWTAGFGIVWPTKVGNLEINFCQVLSSWPTDRTRHGFQLGFSPRPW